MAKAVESLLKAEKIVKALSGELNEKLLDIYQ